MQAAEQELGLASAVLEGKEKLSAGAAAEQAAMQAALAQCSRAESALVSREAALVRTDKEAAEQAAGRRSEGT